MNPLENPWWWLLFVPVAVATLFVASAVAAAIYEGLSKRLRRQMARAWDEGYEDARLRWGPMHNEPPGPNPYRS